jgi:hypothetical protein
MWDCAGAEETFNPKDGLANLIFLLLFFITAAVEFHYVYVYFLTFLLFFVLISCTYFCCFLLPILVTSLSSMKLISGCLVPPVGISCYFSITDLLQTFICLLKSDVFSPVSAVVLTLLSIISGL